MLLETIRAFCPDSAPLPNTMLDGGLRRTGVLLLTLILLTSLLSLPGTQSTHAQPGDVFAAQSDIDADTVLLRVDLQEDGSAMWRVEYRLRLDDENSTEAFESLRTDIQQNRSEYEDRFAAGMRQTVAQAEDDTGRNMTLGAVSVEVTNTTIPQQYGVIAYSFRWEGFTRIEGDQLHAGDAIGGFFIDAETTLIIGWPGGYQLVDVAPPPSEQRDQAVVWTGRRDFTANEPRVIVSPGPATTAPGGGGQPDPGESSDLPWGMIIGVGLIALIGAGVALSVYRRRGGPDPAATESVDDSEEEPPEALLSNEERVLRLLEEHDGRMKQQVVASELEWTDAKTSQVVGKLRDDGEIDVFRLGRENVISLPDESEI